MSYEILDRQEVLKMVEDFTDDIISVVPNLSKSFVWNVIIKNKWNKLYIMDEIFDEKNDKILAQNQNNDNNNNNCIDLKKCCICLDSKSDSIISLDCNHIFCNNCWDDYMLNKIKSVKGIDKITCGEFGCNSLLTYESISRMKSFQKIEEKFKKLIIESFVSNKEFLRFCINDNCLLITKVFRSDVFSSDVFSSDDFTIKCKCGQQMCSKCAQTRHYPIRCDLFEDWILKMSFEEVSKQFIHQDIKRCPKCLIFIELTYGCNTMFCRWCQHMFVWKEGIPVPKKMRNTVSVLLINGNQNDLEKEKPLRRSLNDKYSECYDSFKIIERAFDTLFHCRHNIQLFLIFFHFTQESPQLLQFKNNFKNLRVKVCSLSKTLSSIETKQKMGTEELSQLKKLFQSCQEFLYEMVEDIRIGDEQGLWDYKQDHLEVFNKFSK